MPAEASEEWHHYLPVPDSVSLSSFYLTSVGRSTVRKGEPYPKQNHPRLYHFSWEEGRTLPEFQLLLITQGKGIFDSKETGKVSIATGQAMLLFPDIWHRYRPDRDTGWTEKWMQFDGTMATQLVKHGVISPSRPIVSPPDSRAAEALLDRLQNTIHDAPTTNTLFLSMEALAVIAAVIREGALPPSRFRMAGRGGDAIVVAALDYIWTQGRNVLGVPEVASAIGVTRRTLERHVLATLGHSVLEEIINCRFSRAERLLRSTSLPLKVIVHVSGFGSMENMRQVFVARTEMSPLAYRQFHTSEAA